MKNRKSIYTWIALVFAMIFTGCSSDIDEKITVDESSFQISSTIAQKEDTRLSNNNFGANDKIGLYIIPYGADNSTPGSFPQDAHENNIEYVYNGTNWNPINSTPPVWPGKRKADIYSYYPYNSALSELTSETYTFNIQTDQRTASAHAASDFLWAKSEGLSPVKNVQLTFYHRMSLITVNVLSQIDASTRTASDMEVSLLNITPSAIISMTDGSVSLNASESNTEVQTLVLPDAETGYDISSASIIPPQTITRGNRFLKIKVGDINYYYQPNTDIVLESGKHVIFNINVTMLGLNVDYTIINAWEDGGSFDNNVSEKAPWVVDLSTIDWNKSLVYNIYHKGIQVGRATKEYIFKSGTIDAQAIVVYPMGTEGLPDLTKGFVAQVMNRNRNTTTGQYEANSNSVHGGSVSFNSSDNTFTSYTAGKSALINKIVINSDGSISSANDNAITVLTTQPVLLTDIDNNTYPIVKIGTQYWTAQNFHAEHFQNGDPLTYYYFNDNRDYKESLGALYTWTTIMDSRGIAPEGWQVPGEPDWQSIYRYLTPNAGMKMKANTMWNNLNNGDNVSGFSGLPGGRRTNTGTYNEINSYGQWWASTVYGTNTAYRLYLSSGDNAMHLDNIGTSYTQSVRLISKTPL